MRRLLIMALGSPVFGQDSTCRGNPRHTDDYGDASMEQLNKIRWQFHTGGQVLSSPALPGSSLYVGSSDHVLYALDRQDGILKWKFKTGGRITSSPAVSEGIVYFASFDAYFCALDAATGALKWKFKTKGERRFAAKHITGRSRLRKSCQTLSIFIFRRRWCGTAKCFSAVVTQVFMPLMLHPA
jgi:hypothetical protein